MVRGLDLFIDHFRDFRDQYVLIGGAACDLVFENAGVDFRATRDLDIVLCAEALSRRFVDALWSFIRAGKYEIQEKSTGGKQFYRFRKPRRAEYPSMLEFFSRVPDVFQAGEARHVTPIPVEEEDVSLSAILLDGDYYTWILEGRQVLRDVAIVGPEHIIPLKARAWLDLTGRKAGGRAVDRRDIKKHRNDVFRLLAVIDPSPISGVPEPIRGDMAAFVAAVEDETIDLQALGLGRRDRSDVVAILRTKYGLCV